MNDAERVWSPAPARDSYCDGSLVDQEQFARWYYPAGVTVWQTGETFRVTTFIQLNDVRAEKRDALIEVAEVLRKTNGVKAHMKDEQSFECCAVARICRKSERSKRLFHKWSNCR